MAQLVSFTICDSVNNVPSPNGTVTTLSAPQIAIRPPYIPGALSFGIAIGVSGIELAKPNSFRFVIEDPTGKVVQDSLENALPIQTEEDTLPSEYQGFMISLDIRNLPFEVEGLYTFSFYLNGTLLGAKGIPVFKKA